MSRALFLIFALFLAATMCHASPRIIRRLDRWQFLKGDTPRATAGWKDVSVPHTWNADDGADGGSYYRGPGWYRRTLTIEKTWLSKTIYLRFGAACLVADVFINGEKVGRHEGGFGAFCFDVTKFVHAGSNDLTVRVDNSLNPNVTPLNGDFTLYGGLYREVEMIVQNPVSISRLDHASSGIYLSQTHDSPTPWVSATILVRNGKAGATSVSIKLLAPTGHELTSCGAAFAGTDGQISKYVASVPVENPRLWNGTADPYLYRVRVQVWHDQKPVDADEQPFGVRSFSVDPERGLILNGKPYDMHGVNLHQGRPRVGWAASRANQDEDYKLIEELGATGVRMAHYQHAEHEYDLCDKYGFVVWAELALVNQMTDSPEFRENAKSQLEDLILQNYNHPSIFFWSLYNEPWFDKVKGDQEWHLIDDLNKLAKTIDTGRLTTGAASMGEDSWLNWAMDLGSFNRYWGWYDGGPELWKTRLDEMKQKTDGRSFGMSEFGAGASIHHHENNPSHPQHDGKWHPEEWQAKVHEAAWTALSARPWIWNKLVWVMFDFGSDGRHEGDHMGINDKGLVTGDRKTRKDAFYFYQANWTTRPMVHICDARFTPRPHGSSEIKVYSTASSVTLSMNGKSLGAKKSSNHIFVWQVDLRPGTAVVKASISKASDSVKWQVSEQSF